MSVCSNCLHDKSNGGDCLGLLGMDGHYTWFTPIKEDHIVSYPYYVLDGAQPPSAEDDCFAFSKKEK